MKSTFRSLPSRRRLALIAFAIAAPVALGSGAVLMNPQIRASAVAQAEDVLGLLQDRSPGERSFAILTKKVPRAPGRVVEFPPPDVERGLGKVFPPEPDNPGLEFLTPPEFALLEGPPGEPELSVPITPQGNLAVPPGGGAFAPPGIFLPPGGSFVSEPPGGDSPLTPPTPAVPEPSTWALLLIGFGLCGAAMRAKPGARGGLGRARCKPTV
jgi:hypothetical protein